MTEPEVDLAALFSTVTKTLTKNKASLNEADTYNHNHGDNMVQNFRVITKALKEKQGASPSEQLAYASRKLSQRSTTGSAAQYTEGLSRAAQQLKGQSRIDAGNALSLVQALMGGGQASQPPQAAPDDMMTGLMGALLGGGAPQAHQPTQAQAPDMMSGLMGTLLGGGAPQAPQPTQAQPPDLMSGLMGALLGGAATQPQTPQPAQSQEPDLGALMGALLGGSAQPQQPSHPASSSQGSGGFNLSTLLTAGATYLNAKEQGATPLEALIQAVMAGSQMNNTPYHSQSGQLVAGTLLNTLGSMLGGK